MLTFNVNPFFLLNILGGDFPEQELWTAPVTMSIFVFFCMGWCILSNSHNPP